MDEPDYDAIPAIAMTQWQVGRVLSDDDVCMIADLLKQHDDEMNREIDLFSAARDQVLRELGGQELVDLDAKSSELTGRLVWKRACIRVAEKQADLDRLCQ